MYLTLSTLVTASEAWGAGMARACWQGAIAFAFVWLVCRLPRLGPRAQCRLWRLAYLKLLVALFWATPIDLPLLAAAPRTENGAPPRPALLLHLVRAPRVKSNLPAPPAARARPVALAIEVTAVPRHAPGGPFGLTWLLALWLAGVGWCGRLMAREVGFARRLRGASEPAGDEVLLATLWALCERAGLRRPPRLLIASDVGSPAILGFVQPAILLPRALVAEEPRPALELMLGHEVAHLAHRDLRWGWVAAIAHALFFFHPLVWLANRECRLAQESACDETALRLTGASPGDYARALVRIAARHCVDWRSAPSALWAVDDSPHVLKRRLKMLKQFGRWPRRMAAGSTALAFWRRAGVTSLVAAGVIALVPWRVTAQQAGPAMPPPPAAGPKAPPARSTPPAGTRDWFYLSPAQGWATSFRVAQADSSASADEQWEEMLLLEALHYLKLSRAQLEAMLPLARGAAERLGKVNARERESLATVARVAQRNRADLLAGRSPSTGGQADALRTRAALRERREQTAQEIVSAVLPALTRLLTREQILRAYLLTLGEPPKEQTASAGPALLDREAGFVLGRESWDGWRDNVIRTQLANRYPEKILDASMPRQLTFYSNVLNVVTEDTSSSDLVIRALPAVGLDRSETVGNEGVNTFTFSAPLHDVVLGAPSGDLSPQEKAMADRAAAEAQQLRERYDHFPQLLINGASEAELEAALRNFTRRMFTSPRVQPALEARLGKSGE